MDLNRKFNHLHQTIRQVIDESVMEKRFPQLSAAWRVEGASAFASLSNIKLDQNAAHSLLLRKQTVPNLDLNRQAILLRYESMLQNLFEMARLHFPFTASLAGKISSMIEQQGTRASIEFQQYLSPWKEFKPLSSFQADFFDKEYRLFLETNFSDEFLMQDIIKLANAGIERNEQALLRIIEIYLALLHTRPKYKMYGLFCLHVMNYLLVARDYPPVFIEKADTEHYLQYLEKHRNGDSDLIRFFILNKIHQSLEVSARSIESPYIVPQSSVEPRVNAFIKAEVAENAPNTLLNLHTLKGIVHSVVLPVLRIFYFKMDQFSELFVERQVLLSAKLGGLHSRSRVLHPDQLEELLLSNLEEGEGSIELEFKLLAYRNNSQALSNVSRKISIYLGRQDYKLSCPDLKREHDLLYSSSVSISEMRDILKGLSDSVLEELEEVSHKD